MRIGTAGTLGQAGLPARGQVSARAVGIVVTGAQGQETCGLSASSAQKALPGAMEAPLGVVQGVDVGGQEIGPDDSGLGHAAEQPGLPPEAHLPPGTEEAEVVVAVSRTGRRPGLLLTEEGLGHDGAEGGAEIEHK
jgi:hypothetical protein